MRGKAAETCKKCWPIVMAGGQSGCQSGRQNRYCLSGVGCTNSEACGIRPALQEDRIRANGRSRSCVTSLGSCRAGPAVRGPSRPIAPCRAVVGPRPRPRPARARRLMRPRYDREVVAQVGDAPLGERDRDGGLHRDLRPGHRVREARHDASRLDASGIVVPREQEAPRVQRLLDRSSLLSLLRARDFL
jgi:hypothetical protein